MSRVLGNLSIDNRRIKQGTYLHVTMNSMYMYICGGGRLHVLGNLLIHSVINVHTCMYIYNYKKKNTQQKNPLHHGGGGEGYVVYLRSL